ncbi:hypothetical protein CTA2_3107 [Colletotrichum tanaceti]|nr:hypothetical protein CTA2_3107 [Colletotrichum tanaceti]
MYNLRGHSSAVVKFIAPLTSINGLATSENERSTIYFFVPTAVPTELRGNVPDHGKFIRLVTFLES